MWTPPAWLFAESAAVSSSGEGTHHNSRRANKNFPYFSVPIQPVPSEVRKAIEDKLLQSGDGTLQYSQEKKQLTQLTTKLADQRYRLADMQETVTRLGEQKERGLEYIRAAQQKNTQKMLDKLEKEMRQQFTEERKSREDAWKQELKYAFNEKKRQRQDQYKLIDEEAAQKRQQMEAQAIDSVQSLESIQVLKKQVEEKKQELAELQAKLDGLQETKSEIVWLLKEVIKAEEKNKIKMKDGAKSSPSKMTIPKQA